ncbi:TetR/AcrR family transcriptional regulator [Variovorax sp. OV329]|uniref:TetR/AcrR family transcriptional regulator n=1 Tax=Variovorax sp. OV329 TaxID=1882825 RepID=UPI0015872C18|nr:TetR/AcrR family transcriptional regulator [Variovorax sp. OV329]
MVRNANSPTLEQAREDAPDRKTQIIRSAQKLFALHGYHAVSIRQIADDAGVPLALVRYYYGAKDELFHAIFERWNHVSEQRLALLAEALGERSGAKLLRRVVQAFAAPVLTLRDSEEGTHYAVMLSRELAHPTAEAQRAGQTFLDPMARAFLDALQQTLPLATREQVAWCYQLMIGSLMAHMQELQHARVRGLAGIAPADERIDSGQLLVDFVVGGIQAALSRSASASPTSRVSPAKKGSR